MTKTLRIVRKYDDDSMEFLIGNESIASVNHDEHGWSGMEAVLNALTEMARVLDIDVVEE